jgi:pyruvate/2-oxoglutarate dehydrogenase complex dihydrolipoamide dehydrogenase (E3) component
LLFSGAAPGATPPQFGLRSSVLRSRVSSAHPSWAARASASAAFPRRRGYRPHSRYAFALKEAEETFDKLGIRLDGLRLEFAKANAWKAAVVKQMTQGIAFLFKANGVTWVKGTGTFKDANTIAVEDGEDVIFRSAIIATGSFPLRPSIEGIESNRCVDSEGLLAQTEIPQRLVILGGGVIGCEFASIFQRFGSNVTIIEMLPSLIPQEDADASKELAKQFETVQQARHDAAFRKKVQPDPRCRIGADRPLWRGREHQG